MVLLPDSEDIIITYRCLSSFEETCYPVCRKRPENMSPLSAAREYASNLAHTSKQVVCDGVRRVIKRGVKATAVKSASTAQECLRCRFVDRSNRLEQHTACCGSVAGGGTPTTTRQSLSAPRAAIARSRPPRHARSALRSWRRATSAGAQTPVGRSPTAQSLAQRAWVKR